MILGILNRSGKTQLTWFHWLVGIFIVLRLGVFAYFVIAQGEYISPDSELYLQLASNLVHHQVFSASATAPFSPEVFRTPGYPFFLAVLDKLGVGSPYWVGFWQALIYAASILMFYNYGQALFGPRITRVATLFMLAEPGGLIYPTQILTETLFTPFFLGGILLVGHYLKKPSGRSLALAGGLMGLGTIIRPALLYFPILVACILILFDWRSRLRWLHSGILVLSFTVMISPWLVRNYYYFDTLFMSGATSNMLANFQTADLLQNAKGISYAQAQTQIKQQVRLAVLKQSEVLDRPLSAVEFFKVQQRVALNTIVQYPGAYLFQSLHGITKTMLGTHLTELYDALKIRKDRVHFYDIRATNFIEKMVRFFQAQGLFDLTMILFRLMVSVFALLGVVPIIKQKHCFLFIIMLANFYFICLPGSMGFTRFRVPVEIFWFIQAYMGGAWLIALFQRREHRTKEFS